MIGKKEFQISPFMGNHLRELIQNPTSKTQNRIHEPIQNRMTKVYQWVPVLVLLGLLSAAPAYGCLPAPGSRPASLQERVSQAPLVFEGVVTQVNGSTLTIRVNRYFKGQGQKEIQLDGFNTHSCSTFIEQSGERYLFFAEPAQGKTWNAVYDGAFGTVRPWSEETETELKRLGLLQVQSPRNPNSRPNQGTNLPPAVAEAVLQNAALVTGGMGDRIKIQKAEPRTWPDGCLGIAQPGVMCTQALVNGWLVTVKANEQQLIYRTDSTGNTVYLENAVSVLPASVKQAVLKMAVTQSKLPRNQLNITNAVPRTWDGCLGISTPSQVCTQIAIFGWQVTVEGNNQRWVFHTDSKGSQVRFNAQASDVSSRNSLQPVRMSSGELPPQLPRGAVFQAIASGGITGRTAEITLWSDGKLVWRDLSLRGEAQTVRQRQVSREALQRFENLLRQQQFSRYDRLSFPPPKGSADIISITLVSPVAVTRYAEINTQSLPQPLQMILNSWQQLMQS